MENKRGLPFEFVDDSNLIINGFGYFIGKESERLVIKERGKKIAQFALVNLNHVYINSVATLSTSLINEACRRGIKICIWRGSTPNVLISSPQLSAFVEAKRAQFTAYNNITGLEATKKIIKSKIWNQCAILKYFKKNMGNKKELIEIFKLRAEELTNLMERLDEVKGLNVSECRSTILNIEALAAKGYWTALASMMSSNVGFRGRDPESRDSINSALNFCYALLYANIWMCILNAGLEPFAGFLHTDRPGKASLVYDLSEPFKQRLVDRVIFGILKKKQKLEIKNGLLSNNARKLVSARFLEELSKRELYRGKHLTLTSIIQSNIYSFVDELKGSGAYVPYSIKW
jgi:CRISPR-associated protein Cas1